MRLIDADELMKKVKEWLPTDPCGREEKEFPFEEDICVSMLMEIAEAPTVELTWIPCSERLPDKGGKYIVFGYREDKEEITLCNFRTDLGRFGASWCFDIKAWMPLPPVYKEEGDKK